MSSGAGFSYSDLVLGLCVNADTSDGVETGDWGGDADGTPSDHQPFDVSTLARYDFHLRPSNYAFRVKTRNSAIYDWEEVRRWYGGSNLLEGMVAQDYIIQRLRYQPYNGPHPTEPVIRFPHAQLDDDASLLVLRRHGIHLQPVWVDGDGSCLVHAVSTALTGSQLFYDALRFAIYAEMRDHESHYCTVGLVTDDDFRQRFEPRLAQAAQQAAASGLKDRAASLEEAAREMKAFDNQCAKPRWSQAAYEEALEKARPSEGEILREDRYLEEIHIAAMANVLRRPIMVLGEGYQGGLFLPLRHNPEDCLMPGDGRASPPVLLYQSYEHYVPLVTQRTQDFWDWAEQELDRDTQALDALRGYERARSSTSNLRIPEWVEEISLYVIARSAEKLEETLALYEVDAETREACRQAFGCPAKWADLPMAVVFEDQACVCEKPIRHAPEMNAVFESMHMHPQMNAGSLKLSVYVHKLDFARMQKMLRALYILMDMSHAIVPVNQPAGILPIADNVDKSVWKFVLNFLQKDEINVGMARLYCDGVGWDLGAMCGDERDPRDFLCQELSRLKDRFHRLTGQAFDPLVEEDVSNQAQLQRAPDIRTQLPKALLAMQRVIRERPYPGRGPLAAPAHIELEGLPCTHSSSKDGSNAVVISDDCDDSSSIKGGNDDEGPDGVTTLRSIPLRHVSLAPQHQRHALLGQLLSRYGLPQSHLFEQAALAVLLPERYPEARCRAVLTDWIVSTARDASHANIATDRTGTSGIRKITLRPLLHPVPLPSLRALFPHGKMMGLRPQSPAASSISSLSTSPTSSDYVLVPRPTPTKHDDEATVSLDPPLFSLLRRSRSIGQAGTSPSVSRLRSRPIAIEGEGGGGMAPPIKQELEDEDSGFSFVSRGTTAPF